MRLKAGSNVPEFELTDMSGNKVSKDMLLGSKYMISFYRYASCPFCNLRISFLIEEYKELKKHNFSLIGIFQSDKDDMKKHVEKQKSSFSIISDPNLIEYKKFGVEVSLLGYIKGALKIKKMINAIKTGFKISNSFGPKTRMPADFLVDEKGKIVNAYYAKDISDHLDLDIIIEFATK